MPQKHKQQQEEAGTAARGNDNKRPHKRRRGVWGAVSAWAGAVRSELQVAAGIACLSLPVLVK